MKKLRKIEIFQINKKGNIYVYKKNIYILLLSKLYISKKILQSLKYYIIN